ncbi:MAG: 50S ribosomal protein L23 [Parcubacteria group bacterium]|nr:50S ribosomal protein L23 [Parcubacteria group bacterium]
MAFSSFKTAGITKTNSKKKEAQVFVDPQDNEGAHNVVVYDKVGLLWNLVKHPWFTEKALNGTAQNKYVFKVSPEANKPEVKKLIERGYNVKVSSVHIVNIPGKPRRRGAHKGEKPGYKKAIVTLKKGSTLEVATQ